MSTADRHTEDLSAARPASAQPGEGDAAPAGFFASRWAGLAPVGTVFWRDMLIVGTGINLTAAFISLMALGFKAPTWVAMLIFFAPLPYNLFLVVAMWRGVERQGLRHAGTWRSAALAWLLIVTVI